MLDYFRSYATHFNLLPRIKLHSLVKGISYDGPSSESWSLWNGTGEPFPPIGKWNVTVEDTVSAKTQVYTVDFVILCLGRFKDVPNIPDFPAGRGPEVFRGQAIPSMEYAAMDHETAAEFVKGKRVVVVGFGKTRLDIARECSAINGPDNPCTIVYRHDHWKLPDWAPWGIPFEYLYFNRFSQLLVHKPGEGFLLSLIATLLSPLSWGVSKLVESYIKKKLPIAKFDMVPQHSFSKDTRACLITYMPNPEDFFDKVEKGSIKLKKTPNFSFYDGGISIEDDNTRIETDIVIFAIDSKAQKSSKTFSNHQHFDNLSLVHHESLFTVIGFLEALSNLYISEMRSKWVAALLEGAFKLPRIDEMQKDIAKWDEYMNQSSGEYHYRSSVGGLEIWYNDQLCKDMGVNPVRKNGTLTNLFEPYGPMDYA
ncbi:hypothetical protein L1887_32253 [Cichorium endivia]|nr:hypothetical protein L1887_32253 [Cichorium endivia]